MDEKWATLFRNANLVYLKKLVTILLSMFSSNAFSEFVFSVMKNVKSDDRNRMKIRLMNSLVSIKFNADFCKAYDVFLSEPDLLKQAKSCEKYEK